MAIMVAIKKMRRNVFSAPARCHIFLYQMKPILFKQSISYKFKIVIHKINLLWPAVNTWHEYR